MLIPILVSMWAAIAFAMYFIEFTHLHRVKIRGRQPFNRKPFSCETCLPFWLVAVFLPIATYGCAWVAAFAAACTAGILTPIILKAIRK